MKKLIVSLATIALLSGCSQTQMSEFTDSISSTLGSLVSVDTGNGSNQSSSSSSSEKLPEIRGEFSLTVPQDVDTVFAAMITEFEFPSPEYIKQKNSADDEIIMSDAYYHYERNPSAYYYLGYGYLSHKSANLALKMKLVKSGKGTKITGNYIYFAQSTTIKNEIIARIKKALN
ncbi:hypothetical protein RHO12_01710 [Orbus sturtevantii]|uniref:hypothetical protein n=1 Tax=Orbus sturtevantii TaxID=3074109 RepID=UPI00370D98FA